MTEKDVIVIGSGPAGYTASIYLARAMLEPLLFEGFSTGGMVGGQLMTTNFVENFPGFSKGIGGQELMTEMRKQVTNNGVECIMSDILSLEKNGDKFILTDSNDDKFSAKSVIVATGANVRRLNIESERKFWTRGISACAVCDGGLPIFRKKKLAVIGGGDSAVEEAIYLTKFASKVYLVHRRDTLRASKIMQEHLRKNEKIGVLYNKVPVEFYGENLLERMKLRDTITNDVLTMDINGCFEAIGNVPNTKFLGDTVNLNDDGYILTDNDNMTSVPGIFAAGDVANPNYKQAIIAAGDGARAALACERWLSNL